jgi:hypothetical protein
MRAIPAVWVFFVQPLPLAQETKHVTAKSRAGVPLVPPVAVARRRSNATNRDRVSTGRLCRTSRPSCTASHRPTPHRREAGQCRAVELTQQCFSAGKVSAAAVAVTRSLLDPPEGAPSPSHSHSHSHSHSYTHAHTHFHARQLHWMYRAQQRRTRATRFACSSWSPSGTIAIENLRMDLVAADCLAVPNEPLATASSRSAPRYFARADGATAQAVGIAAFGTRHAAQR